MKIRSIVDLQTAIDDDFSWRRQELTTIIFTVRKTSGRTINYVVRTALPLLYAHWEGFIKNVASYYLEYVSIQRLPYNNLANCFVATALRQKINDFSNTSKATRHLLFIEYLDTFGIEVPRFNAELIIKTGSNLNSAILKEILSVVGISYSPFELKANLIDEQLLKYRNTIAHGEQLALEKHDYEHLHKEIYDMMIQIKTEIENAAFLKAYKKQ